MPTASPSMLRQGRALSTSLIVHVTAAALLFTIQFSETRAMLAPSSFHVALLVPPVSPREVVAISKPPVILPAPSAAPTPAPPRARAFSLPAPVSHQAILEVPAAPALEPVRSSIPVLPITEIPKLSAPPMRVDNLTPALPFASSQAPAGAKVIADAGFGQGAVAGASGKMQSAGVALGSFGESATKGSGQTPAVSLKTASVRSGGFGDAQVSRAESVAGKVPMYSARPIEILAKPKPAYTDEARRLGIEGEVLVEMTFAASGEIRILRLVRGLGHGLDESALAAARAIRFRPAEQSGAAVDFTAIVHILFQLA